MNSSSTVNTEDIYKFIDNIVEARNVMIIIVIIIILYWLFSKTKTTSYSDKYLGNTVSASNGSGIVQALLIIFIIVLILFGLLRFFFGIDVFLDYKNIFKKEIKLTAVEPTKGEKFPVISKIISQVFNIPGNNYTYKEAESLCKAYGADLASYSQLEKAYNNGADWCNYGWSQGQMAFFPTQQKTFDELQKIKGHENDCGRPGINGGYMANPYNRYGVNCYGVKPKMTEQEKSLMKLHNTPDNIKIEADVNFWKDKIPDILISPFNSNTWSKL